MHSHPGAAGRHVVAAAAVLWIVGAFASVASAAPTGKSFATPEKAAEAMAQAMRNRDEKALLAIFGKGSEPLFKTDDPTVDSSTRKHFVELYDAKHEIVTDDSGSRTLMIGTDAWPMPIPLVKTKSGWAFDTAAGFDAVISRRIGRDELLTIQTCLAVGDAQREYYSRDRDGDGVLEFAQKFRSTVGLRDGLFWRAEAGESPSPLGEFAAAAAAEGYVPASGMYHGYHYKMLYAQGPSAEGGAYSYLARDNLIGGFALLAFPAAYGETGVMSFIMNHGGVVYQRDLGEQTEAEAAKITTFDPGEGWTRVPDKDLAPIPTE